MENQTTIIKPLKKYIEGLAPPKLSDERKKVLRPLVDFINAKATAHQPILLNFICTHNSRRSHLAQVWAQTMAAYFNVENVVCYSGGTEATAVYPLIVQTLEEAGFQISKETSTENPVYHIKYATDKIPLQAYSKKYDDNENPKSGFAAVMTCSQADAGCPFVAGSEKRISIMYEDPKVSDGTAQQQKVYKERSEQIATEMKYIFSKINL